MLKYLWRLVLLALGVAALPDAAAVASKWESRTTGAVQDYLDGVARTDKDPTQLAIAAIPRMKTNLIAAIDNGKVANGLRRVGKAGWQEAVAAKGGSNFQSGVSASKDKVETAFRALLGFEATLQQKVNAMPNVTDADREQRMLTWVRNMRTYTKA